ncbi:MAG: NUDIX domain-containing protein [Erysipelotrichaceae bacterium]|nr:NUDIX domain-containing protein [Erysipelotrichaceae bacterium]
MAIPRMRHCMECGTKLEMKYLKSEGKEIPYCTTCEDYRFPVFNTAVSMIVTNETKDKILLIKQYGRDIYILVAGYVNQGEDAEDAVVREVKEEMDLDVISLHFNHSHYYARSNTLMLNYTVVVKGQTPHPNGEIDQWNWFTVDQARKNIHDKSLAQAFLYGYLDGVYDFDPCDHKYDK